MPLFDVDDQTLSDLEIFHRSKGKSLFSFFDQTKTIEGSSTLKLIFQNPSTDAQLISERKHLIEYLQLSSIDFDLDKESIDFVEFYLRQNSPSKKPSSLFLLKRALRDYFALSKDIYIRKRGVSEVLELIIYLNSLLFDLGELKQNIFLKKFRESLIALNSNKRISKIIARKHFKLTSYESIQLDYEIRNVENNKLKDLLTLMYELDAYFSVAKTSRQHSLTYPTLKQSDEQFINIKGLRHIFINNPITNNIHLCSTKNVSFITGVNMAGKSTFLKAVGINVYLSHLGFPVPAQEMTISIFDGLMTTVNIKDDLNAGYSHFYTEVKRVKEVADKINEAKRIVVIFDELFRGTNLKDAHEASVSIINAFTKIKMCLFLISTHITEVADDLKHNQNVDFNYFGTKMINNSPVFSRQLKSGINYDRLGLWIIQQENILQILNENADR